VGPLYAPQSEANISPDIKSNPPDQVSVKAGPAQSETMMALAAAGADATVRAISGAEPPVDHKCV